MELAIQAAKRSALGKQNNKLRKQGILPAVLYGKGKASTALELNLLDFNKAYKEAGENTLIDLTVDGGKPTKVLIQDVSKHYMKDLPIHVDFYEVDLTKKVRSKVPVHFIGTSPAVREFAGILLHGMEEVEVEALPEDLPKNIQVDLSVLKQLNDAIRVSDLVVGENITILSHPEDAVAIIKPPRTMEEIEALDEEIVDEGLPAKEEAEEGEEAGAEAEEGEKGGEEGAEPDKPADAAEGKDDKKG